MSDATPQASVEERLRNDLKDATRQRDQVRMDTIRMALAAFRTEEVTGTRHERTEQERQAILDKLIKQRHESAGLFRTAKRDELADKEEREAAMLEAYLPAKLTDDGFARWSRGHRRAGQRLPHGDAAGLEGDEGSRRRQARQRDRPRDDQLSDQWDNITLAREDPVSVLLGFALMELLCAKYYTHSPFHSLSLRSLLRYDASVKKGSAHA